MIILFSKVISLFMTVFTVIIFNLNIKKLLVFKFCNYVVVLFGQSMYTPLNFP